VQSIGSRGDCPDNPIAVGLSGSEGLPRPCWLRVALFQEHFHRAPWSDQRPRCRLLKDRVPPRG